MTLGEKIRKLRLENDLSQVQLADKLFVSRQAITKWENDKGTPDINNLKSIASLFNVTVDYLISINDESCKSEVVREKISIEEYKKEGKCRSKYDAVVYAKYRDADKIYALIRTKKLNKIEFVLDLIVEPGIFNVTDSLSNLDAYYIIESNDKQLLVRVSKEVIESRVLNIKINGKKFELEGNIFKKVYTL